MHTQQQTFGQQAQPNQQKQPANVLNILFLAGAAISAINCFARADYNLPIFLFAYLAWDINYGKQQLRIIYLFIYSCIVDLFYIIYWGSSMGAFINNLDWLNSVYIFTLIMTSILMIVKFGIVFKVLTSNDQLQDQVSIGGIAENLTLFFKSDQNAALYAHQGDHNAHNPHNPHYIPQGNYEQNIHALESQHLGKNLY